MTMTRQIDYKGCTCCYWCVSISNKKYFCILSETNNLTIGHNTIGLTLLWILTLTQNRVTLADWQHDFVQCSGHFWGVRWCHTNLPLWTITALAIANTVKVFCASFNVTLSFHGPYKWACEWLCITAGWIRSNCICPFNFITLAIHTEARCNVSQATWAVYETLAL